jgi:hypothetical protein
MSDTETAVRKLVEQEPVLIIRPAVASLKYQTDTTASSQPEGVIVQSPLRRTGVVIRETFESTSVPLSFIR